MSALCLAEWSWSLEALLTPGGNDTVNKQDLCSTQLVCRTCCTGLYFTHRVRGSSPGVPGTTGNESPNLYRGEGRESNLSPF